MTSLFFFLLVSSASGEERGGFDERLPSRAVGVLCIHFSNTTVGVIMYGCGISNRLYHSVGVSLCY